MSEPNMSNSPRWGFIPTISFDGVAIITACIMCAVWLGSLGTRVSDLEQSQLQQNRIIEQIADAQKTMAQNIAVLTTLVNERTLKSKP